MSHGESFVLPDGKTAWRSYNDFNNYWVDGKWRYISDESWSCAYCGTIFFERREGCIKCGASYTPRAKQRQVTIHGTSYVEDVAPNSKNAFELLGDAVIGIIKGKRI